MDLLHAITILLLLIIIYILLRKEITITFKTKSENFETKPEDVKLKVDIIPETDDSLELDTVSSEDTSDKLLVDWLTRANNSYTTPSRKKCGIYSLSNQIIKNSMKNLKSNFI